MMYKLEEQLEFGEASDLKRALQQALSAMSDYGSYDYDMEIVGKLYIMACQQYAEAFKRLEHESKDTTK